MKSKLKSVFLGLMNLQQKLTPRQLVLKVIYLLSFLFLSVFTENGITIITTLVLCVYLSVKDKFPETDKLEHYYWGLIYFCLISLPLVKLLGFEKIWLILPALILGASKEGLDALGLGNTEVNDFIKTVQFSVVYYILFN